MTEFPDTDNRSNRFYVRYQILCGICKPQQAQPQRDRSLSSVHVAQDLCTSRYESGQNSIFSSANFNPEQFPYELMDKIGENAPKIHIISFSKVPARRVDVNAPDGRHRPSVGRPTCRGVPPRQTSGCGRRAGGSCRRSC